MLGITLLLVVVAVQNGLFRDAEKRILDVVPHVVLPQQSVPKETIESLRESNKVLRVERFAELYALMSVEGYTVSVVVHAVDSSAEIEASTIRHNWDYETDNAAIDRGSIPLGSLSSGGLFRLTFPLATTGGATAQQTWFRWTADTSGNSGVAFPLVVVHVDDLIRKEVLVPDQIDWRITLRNPWEADAMFSDFAGALTWTHVHAEYFRALSMEKTILFVMLTFVIALASLNIVSGQAMLINSKKTDIAILRTLGADGLLLNLAFAMHGLIIVVAGIVVGVLAGVLIGDTFEHLLRFLMTIFPVSPEVGVLYAVQPFLRPTDLIATVTVSFTIACLGVLRPLALVLKTNPIDALHSPA